MPYEIVNEGAGPIPKKKRTRKEEDDEEFARYTARHKGIGGKWEREQWEIDRKAKTRADNTKWEADRLERLSRLIEAKRRK